jgi:hypothetical protein
VTSAAAEWLIYFFNHEEHEGLHKGHKEKKGSQKKKPPLPDGFLHL